MGILLAYVLTCMAIAIPSVGTMMVKALESVADETGYLSATDGYTRLHLTSARKPRSVDGLLPRSRRGWERGYSS